MAMCPNMSHMSLSVWQRIIQTCYLFYTDICKWDQRKIGLADMFTLGCMLKLNRVCLKTKNWSDQDNTVQ